MHQGPRPSHSSLPGAGGAPQSAGAALECPRTAQRHHSTNDTQECQPQRLARDTMCTGRPRRYKSARGAEQPPHRCARHIVPTARADNRGPRTPVGRAMLARPPIPVQLDSPSCSSFSAHPLECCAFSVEKMRAMKDHFTERGRNTEVAKERDRAWPGRWPGATAGLEPRATVWCGSLLGLHFVCAPWPP